MMVLAAGAITFALTTVLTIAGVGAAFILIPVFVGLGVDLHAAMATALLLNAVAMAVASGRNAHKGFIDYRAGVPILVAASLLSPIGAIASRGLDQRILLGLFAGFLLVAAAMMLFYAPRPRTVAKPSVRVDAEAASVGVAAGFIGGLLGVGGGNVIMPALVGLGVEPRRASATSSFAAVFASAAGFLGHVSVAALDPRLTIATGLGAGAGALVGSYLVTEKFKGECGFRPMPITDSGACRSPIPVEADHRFRSMPIAERMTR